MMEEANSLAEKFNSLLMFIWGILEKLQFFSSYGLGKVKVQMTLFAVLWPGIMSSLLQINLFSSLKRCNSEEKHAIRIPNGEVIRSQRITKDGRAVALKNIGIYHLDCSVSIIDGKNMMSPHDEGSQSSLAINQEQEEQCMVLEHVLNNRKAKGFKQALGEDIKILMSFYEPSQRGQNCWQYIGESSTLGIIHGQELFCYF
ncbi:hypothetical protein ACLB2K_072874 [Fragaria x ananassa]